MGFLTNEEAFHKHTLGGKLHVKVLKYPAGSFDALENEYVFELKCGQVDVSFGGGNQLFVEEFNDAGAVISLQTRTGKPLRRFLVHRGTVYNLNLNFIDYSVKIVLGVSN